MGALMRMPETAEVLGVSLATVYRMHEAGQLPYIRLGDGGAIRVIRARLVEMYGIAEPA